MNSLIEDIKNKTLKVGNVYVNSDRHHILINGVNMCKDTYKVYPILNSILTKIFPIIISKATNWTFTIQTQSKLVIFGDNEDDNIRGVSAMSIISVDYDTDYKKFKEYENYILKEVEFPFTPLTKTMKKKK